MSFGSTTNESEEELYELCILNGFYDFSLVVKPKLRRSASAPHMLGTLDTVAHPADSVDTCPQKAKTLMLRDIPCKVDEERIESVLREQGFAGTYDYLYDPKSKSNGNTVGYCFVNFLDLEDASRFRTIFDGYTFSGSQSKKKCHVTTADIQGREANIEAHAKTRRFKK
eukprot:TRINITY_DN6613_c1_g7_i1.p1 TRINITY_DN6613_c1_g7~~TRINITY_DN6613_c1_g7_i1.p1  ORF type:complete len:169 (+),score=30.57 TRINITY_DN6613_c1_g7_i1:77-583(+)